MRRQHRRMLRGFVACAAAGLVLAGVAGADSQTFFVDPTGDAGSSVDLTGLGPGTYTLPVHVESPQGAGVARVLPATLQVVINSGKN